MSPAQQSAATRLLCIGDLHIGRTPTRVPQALMADAGMPEADITPGAALERLTAWALEHDVNAVLLAGDVVDSDHRFYGSVGVLERCAARLAAAGIAVVAVAGNHDTRVLPELAASIDGVTLLGAGGTWEGMTLSHSGLPAVRVVGWSHPAAGARTNPFDQWQAQRSTAVQHDSGLPTVGLLHADATDANSPHAPIHRRDLAAASVDAWLLGHIHLPDRLDEMDPPEGYLGSVQGLDPGEDGWRGAWVADVGPGSVSMQRLDCAAVRYERVDVDLDGVVDDAEVPRRVRAALAAVAGRINEDRAADDAAPEQLLVVGRLRLTGAVADPAACLAAARGADGDGLEQMVVVAGHVAAAAEATIIDDLEIAFDLDRLVAGGGVRGALAAMVRGDDIDAELLTRVTRAAEASEPPAVARHLTPTAVDPDQLVREQARDLLTALEPPDSGSSA